MDDFMNKRSVLLKELADDVKGSLLGDPDIQIRGVAGIREAEEGEITFLSNPKYAPYLNKTRASAVIVGEKVEGTSCAQLIVKNPYYAFAIILQRFADRPVPASGIHPRAFIGENVRMGKPVSIAPMAVIDDGAEIGSGTVIYPGVYVGKGARIGDHSILYSNVSISDGIRIGKRVIIHSGAVIGSDGFGFATQGGRHHKIPQVGSVEVEDDVEIGANVTIDRGALGNTVVGRGTKIDNLVQIAHNVQVGEDCLLISQVGISGSVEIGNRVTLAGQTGVAGHLKIGDNVIAAARAGIAKDVQSNEVVSGSPAIPHREWLSAAVLFSKLPEFRKRIMALEKKNLAQGTNSLTEDKTTGKNRRENKKGKIK